ncbi:hypothetical protein K466DRAFT_388225 [Polyporus arcularius HHB13444]|uniref:Uncharacterized protein n=1 Tax=Polyporus arcularius HHB13444 TaxID=1314778 RepID=A0A5C3PM32_9APHY|nr:hypothetical protein K466DRAFT_388225 [Polyporus arcularius HHB13444]
MGTSVCLKVFTPSGWGALTMMFSLVVLLLRGPHAPRYTWLGWQGEFKPVFCAHELGGCPGDATCARCTRPLNQLVIVSRQRLPATRPPHALD